jgi:hypothetical protein
MQMASTVASEDISSLGSKADAVDDEQSTSSAEDMTGQPNLDYQYVLVVRPHKSNSKASSSDHQFLFDFDFDHLMKSFEANIPLLPKPQVDADEIVCCIHSNQYLFSISLLTVEQDKIFKIVEISGETARAHSEKSNSSGRSCSSQICRTRNVIIQIILVSCAFATIFISITSSISKFTFQGSRPGQASECDSAASVGAGSAASICGRT